MVERISTTGISAIRSSDPWSVAVHVSDRRPTQSDNRKRAPAKSPYQHLDEDAVVYGRYRDSRQGSLADSDRDGSGVLIDRSTSMLLVDDLGGMIARTGANLRLLTIRLLGVRPETADSLIENFTQACLEEIGGAIARYTKAAGTDNRAPIGLAFDDVRVQADHNTGRLVLNVGSANFVDTVDFRATGVVFDVRGSEAVHKPRPGVFVDTGTHGAAIANTIIEKVRRDLPEFGSEVDTEGVIVLIRADRSDYSDHTRLDETLDFDLLIPFRGRI